MRAVILAAGKGTRMGALTEDIPKPMIPVAGKPVVEHVMRRLIDAGVSEFILVTRYLSEKIKDYFGDGAALGTRIRYVDQGDGYGTGAALLAAKELAGDAPLLMTFADVVTSTQTYHGALAVFAAKGGAGVVTLNWMDDPFSGAAVVLDEAERVCKIIEKPPKGQILSHWNSAGIFVFDPVVFDHLERLQPSWRGEYELADAMNSMIAGGLALHPSYLQGDWLDVGTVEAISVAEEILSKDG